MRANEAARHQRLKNQKATPTTTGEKPARRKKTQNRAPERHQKNEPPRIGTDTTLVLTCANRVVKPSCHLGDLPPHPFSRRLVSLCLFSLSLSQSCHLIPFRVARSVSVCLSLSLFFSFSLSSCCSSAIAFATLFESRRSRHSQLRG